MRFLIKALLAGAGFGIGLVGVLWVISKQNPVGLDDFHIDSIKKIEYKIGMSCLQAHKDAVAFTKNNIGEIINRGLKGEDWVAIISPYEKQYIDSRSSFLWECRSAEYHAERVFLNWPNFNELHSLFSSLEAFTTEYGSGPATASRLKPEAFNRFQFEYQNVTRQLKRAP